MKARTVSVQEKAKEKRRRAVSKRAPDEFQLIRADLARSGIRVNARGDLAKLGIRVLTRTEALEQYPSCPWWRSAPDGLACALFEYRDLGGKYTAFGRLRRLEDPPPGPFRVKPDLPRYYQPSGTLPQLYFAPTVRWAEVLASAAEKKARVVFVEGEKKALAICQAGGGVDVAIGLGGVWNFTSRGQGVEVIPDLLHVTALAKGFTPVVCFDADKKPETRREVRAAASRLGRILRLQGVEPLLAELPTGDGKVGPDDFIVTKGWKAFQKVLDAAGPLFPPEALSDVGNAGRLASVIAGSFIRVAKWERWLRWDGRRWADDEKGAIGEVAIEVARSLLQEASRERDLERAKKLATFAIASQKRERIAAMISLAADAWPELKVAPVDLDRDEWVLNVENGTLDLRTGAIRPHSQRDLITKLAPVAYDPAARAPLWEKVLAEVLPSAGVRSFLKRYIGYSLTGSVRENKLAFFHGRGQNGKNVITNTVLRMLGDYAATAPEGLLLASWGGDKHPTELTDLHGKRFVLASETSDGRSWDEGRVKRLTGGDDVKARRMREDFWTFRPSHKFTVLSNSRPKARPEDEAIWLRMKLVPFKVSFRGADDLDPARATWPVADRELEAKLRREWPGILRWAVEGCLEWQKEGLGDPPEMREAVSEYREEQRELDPINAYLALTAVPETGVPLKEFAAGYNAFARAELHGRDLMVIRKIAERLRGHGYTVEPHGRGGLMRVFPPRSARKAPSSRKVVVLAEQKKRKF